jgi:hypothetical protein
MELFSKGNFYAGVDKEKFCDFDIHLGRLVIQYTCPSGQATTPKDDGTSNESSQGSDN